METLNRGFIKIRYADVLDSSPRLDYVANGNPWYADHALRPSIGYGHAGRSADCDGQISPSMCYLGISVLSG